MKLLARRNPPPAPPAGLPLPDSIEVEARRMRVGDGWCSTLGIAGYPR